MIPANELAQQQREAIATDLTGEGWLTPAQARNLNEQLAAAIATSEGYRTSMEHYLERVGKLEEEIRTLRSAQEAGKSAGRG